MKSTLSIIKADIGSIGGHITPSKSVFEVVGNHIAKTVIISDYRLFHTGDDIAILMAHGKGKLNEEVHKLAWEAFLEGTKVAKEQGLYGAGQDLLKDAFSGNVKGMGPAVAEIEFEERPAEPVLAFFADKTDPGAFNLPLYLSFADPMFNSGLILSPKVGRGFKFTIMDVSFTKADRVIELATPGDIYDIATLLRDPETYIIEKIETLDGTPVVSVSTTRLHNIAGKYTGKDDPVMLIRTQSDFPATGEILSPYVIVPYVAGDCRGSHNIPLMPVKVNSTISYFDGPAIVSGVGFCLHNGKLTEVADLFDHPFWDGIRQKATEKTLAIREQGFFGAAMLGMNELEYGGIVERLAKLEKQFKVRE